MTFDRAFMDEMRALDDEINRDLQEAGLVFAEHAVKLATVTLTGADTFSGSPGTPGDPTYKVLDPRPDVDLREQIRYRAGAPTVVGQALLEVSRNACTRDELVGAAWIEVSKADDPDAPGDRFKVNEGEIRETWDRWKVVLQRLL